MIPPALAGLEQVRRDLEHQPAWNARDEVP
jgi:hypothetical protein